MAEKNPNLRLEAFSDGVFAIALTLLVIDIKIPDLESIRSSAELWVALQHLAPSVFAFILSFGVILITWVNHDGMVKTLKGSSASFVYANGFLLLTVVFIPFPTGLLGDTIWTDHAAPAVVLYDAVLAVQAIGWILLIGAALKNHLVDGEQATAMMRENRRHGYFALALYSLLSLAGAWFPVAVAVITTATWALWLAISIRLKTT